MTDPYRIYVAFEVSRGFNAEDAQNRLEGALKAGFPKSLGTYKILAHGETDQKESTS